jgi:hypothetical protein
LILNEYGTDGTDGNIICRVDYGEAGFPTGLNGCSMQLAPDITEVDDALLGTNWCASTLTFASGDLGTPGTQNTTCQ